jgi:hypothetical protein
MSDPDALLRACLRHRCDPGGGAALRARIGALDADAWETLRALAEAERVAPLLHDALGGLGLAPATVVDSLRQSRRATWLRNLLLLRELARALQRLAAAGVPAIVLKGVALVEAVYGDASLRPMGDVDLLVRRGDLAEASNALRQIGYAFGRAETHPGALAEHENELLFCKRDRIDVQLDVHWSLFDSPFYQAHIAMDWFWDTAQPLSINGTPALMLGPEALLIHLCGHLALHHGGAGLLWSYDIVELVRRYGERLDWAALLRKIGEYDLVLPVRGVLVALGAEWDARLPAEVLAALRLHPHSRAEARAAARMSRSEHPAGRRFWADLASMPGWRQRVRFALTNLFPSAAYMRHRYGVTHPLLLPLYYPYRWLRGLRGTR